MLKKTSIGRKFYFFKSILIKKNENLMIIIMNIKIIDNMTLIIRFLEHLSIWSSKLKKASKFLISKRNFKFNFLLIFNYLQMHQYLKFLCTKNHPHLWNARIHFVLVLLGLSGICRKRKKDLRILRGLFVFLFIGRGGKICMLGVV